MKFESKQTSICIRIPQDLLDKVKEKAEATNTNVSAVIKIMLSQWVNGDKPLI